MYICPVCNEKYFSTEDAVRKHYLSCWKRHNPSHQSKSAPRNEQIVSYDMNDDILEFFNSFKEK